jgi:hypothetical protein
MAKSIQARIDILVDAAKAQAALKRVTRETDKFNRSTKNVKGNPFKSVTRSVAGLAGAYIGAQGLITVIQGSIREQQESIKVGRQTNAVLKSTKSAAGLSAKAISDLAQALSEKTAVDDDAIQSAENLLLTFTKIGKDTFPAATAAVLDLSAATGTSLKGASIQVGKALQDPVRGLTALRKVGVNFSTDQTDVIKKLVATGKTAEAQKLILKELATEFGGSAAAQATPLDRLKVTYQNLLETIGGYLVPVLNDVAEATIKFVDQFRQGKGAGGEFKDTLKGIYDTLKPIVAFLINHPQVVAGAAAAYIGFKATLAALNLFTTLMTAFGSVQAFAAAGGLRGRAFSVGLGVGLVVGIPLALAGIADMISQRLIPKNMSSQMQGAFGFTGGIAERFGKWWAHLKGLASAGWSFLKNLFAGKGKGGTMGFIQAPSFKGLPKIIASVRSTMSDAVRAVTSKAGAFISAGGQLVAGLASGIRNAAGKAIAAAGDLASSLPSWVKKVLGISSPSKVFAEIGASIVAGMAAGMSKTAPITKAADKIVKAATPSSATAFGLGSEVADREALVKARALVGSSKGKAKTTAQAALSKL